jgi:hypothetical protein
VLSYRVTLDVPFQLAVFVSKLLADHRREIGTRWAGPLYVPSRIKPHTRAERHGRRRQPVADVAGLIVLDQDRDRRTREVPGFTWAAPGR